MSLSISNYEQAIEQLDQESVELSKKAGQLRWQRYICRRLSLYSCAGFSLFFFSALSLLVKGIAIKDLALWLRAIDSFINQHTLSIAACLFVSSGAIACFECYTSGKKKREIAISMLLQLTLVTCLFSILAIQKVTFVLITGLIGLGLVCFMAIFVDYTLGFTRRNERYQLFSKKAESLTIYLKSKQDLGIAFSVTELDAIMAFYQQLRSSKHDHTVSDTFFLAEQLQKKFGGA